MNCITQSFEEIVEGHKNDRACVDNCRGHHISRGKLDSMYRRTAASVVQNIPVKGNTFRISVYFADASELEDDKLFCDIYFTASEYRKKKTDRYYFRKDKNLSLCAEYLLMCGCNDFDINYNEQVILFGNNAKPFFLDSHIYFNLSHSEEKAMCIMSQHEVGCDIERIGIYDMDIANNSFSKEEIDSLLSCNTEEEKNLLFYRIWTLKESFIKCTGMGMSDSMSSISVISNGKIKTYYSDCGNEYFLFEGRIDNSYQYALCIRMDEIKTDNYEAVKKQISIFREMFLR